MLKTQASGDEIDLRRRIFKMKMNMIALRKKCFVKQIDFNFQRNAEFDPTVGINEDNIFVKLILLALNWCS